MYYYLIINEGLSNGLIESQVISPIIYNNLEKEVGVISLERPGRKSKLFKNIRKKIFYIAIPYRLFLFNSLSIFISPLAYLYAIFLSFRINKKDVIIARSYFPGLVAFYINKINGNNYIFDPRSLFIHESITNGNLLNESRLYNKWKNWERKILINAHKINVVSEAQLDYYATVVDGLTTKVVNIPCYCTDNELVGGQRKLLPFSNNDIVVVYYGSLDHGWNNTDVYLDFFSKIIERGYKVCIVSQNFRKLLLDKRFEKPEIYIVDTHVNTNYQAYLQACDYGIIIMPKVLDWKTRLSVKFVEYLNNGLGVLIGEFVGEAVRIANLYFSDSCKIIKTVDDVCDLKAIDTEERSKIKSIAEKLFGMQNFHKLLER